MLHPSRIFSLFLLLSLIYLVWWSKQDRYAQPIVINENVKSVVVIDEPKTSGNYQKIIVKERSEEQFYEIITGQFPEFLIGDLLDIEGVPQSVGKEDPFYHNHLLRGVIAIYSFPQIDKTGFAGPGSEETFIWLRRILVSVRKKLSGSVSGYLHEPQAGLLNGIIFGERGNFPSSLSTAFSRTGLTHIVALSGYNITIVIAFLSIIINRGNRRLFTVLCVLGIAIFILATGLSSSVIRAGLMGSVFLLAGFWGRRPDGLVAILFAAFIMSLANPYILAYDIGFQLSFAAMLGMILLAPKIEALLVALGHTFSQVVASTIAAQIFTWPIISANFGIFSVVSPISNLLVLPLIPAVMFFGFSFSVVGLFSPSLAKIASLIPWFLTTYIAKVAELLSLINFSAVPLEFTSPILIYGYYLLIIDFILILNGRKNAKKIA